MVEDHFSRATVACALCGEKFLAEGQEPLATTGIQRLKRPKKEMPLSNVIGLSIVGVVSIGILVGVLWFFAVEVPRAKVREAENLAQRQRLREERDHARREEKQERAERDREEARLGELRKRQEREVDSGLTTYAVEARALYMDAWKARGLETNEKLALLEKWPDRVDELNADPRAKIDLEEKGLVGTDLRRMMATWMNAGSDDDGVKKTTAKWDEVFGLKDGVPTSEEQIARIKHQEAKAEAMVVAEVKADTEAFITGLSSSSSSSFAGDGGYEQEAWGFIQRVVELKLVSPKSADFPFGGHRSVKSIGGGRYKVESYVDATNAFGAEIRTPFVCVVEDQGGGRFTLVSLDM